MPTPAAEIPTEERWFEDYPAGEVFTSREIAVGEAEILGFARRFDPQPMHVDPAAAGEGRFGGLIASGWHTAALTMSLIVESFLSKRASLASPGIDELRWARPVRPGDRLHIRATVVEARRSRSNPRQGVVRSFVEVINQEGETVMTMRPVNLLACRTPGEAG
ncbi:MAG TPA: MaoC family dehydratase [Stellaceae bacterium]|nr:MaoC family dehydratase [Stellaceae bacterium]